MRFVRSSTAGITGLAMICGLLLTTSAPSVSGSAPPAPHRAAAKPNVVLLLLDDATLTDMKHMPNVQRLLVDQGASFTNNYSPTSECCPARAVILSGQYPHNNGVLSKSGPNGGIGPFNDRSTIATWVEDTHRTGYLGKYLNGYGYTPGREKTYVSPGWDIWKAPSGSTYDYTGQNVNVNGTMMDFSGINSTDLYGKLTRSFIESTGRPFFSFTNFVAPHTGLPNEPGDPEGVATPWVAPEYRGTYDGPLPSQKPWFNEPDMSDKRPSMRDRRRITKARAAKIDIQHAQRIEALYTVDDQVQAIVNEVGAARQMDNTYFILASDNGFFQGQHRIARGKSQPYEPSSNVPLIVRGPGVREGISIDVPTTLADIAPTVLGMMKRSRANGDHVIDGRDLMPLLDRTRNTFRRPVLLEGIAGKHISDARALRMPSVGREAPVWVSRSIVSRSGHWKLTRYPQEGAQEMYHLRRDPHELRNRAGDAAVAGVRAKLIRALKGLVRCAGAACR